MSQYNYYSFSDDNEDYKINPAQIFPYDNYPSLDIFDSNYMSNLFDGTGEEENKITRIIFITTTKIKGKPGKKIPFSYARKKRNRAIDKDNILCEIQTSFFNFLVNLANDAIKVEPNVKEKLNFKHVEHSLKIDVSYVNMLKLKKSPINYILQMKISDKYKKLSKDKDYNKKVYEKLVTKSKWLEDLFNMNFLDAFKLYYNDCKALNSIIYNNKRINITKKKYTFYSLYIKSNDEKRKKLIEVIKDYYLKESKADNSEIEKAEKK